MKISLTLGLALGLVFVMGPAAEAARPLDYAVIGDTPYGQPQIDNFPNDVAELNAAKRVRLVLHLGDIKNGSTVCSTSYFQQIRADFDLFRDPLVYTPGDNEWTDCHRANNGGYLPIERLATLRTLFFDRPGRTLGKRPKKVEAQSSVYPENVHWRQRHVEFGVLDLPGSDNDWAPWFGQPRTAGQIDEVTGRTAADLDWLSHIFSTAKAHRARAVVIGVQADLWDPVFTGSAAGLGADPTQFDHFTSIVQRLATEARAFGKPVLLLNGDSHQFTDDHPLADPARPQNKAIYGIAGDVPNLRRITVNGSTTPCHEWLRLHIAPKSESVFSYQRVRFSRQPAFDPAVCPTG